MNLTGLHLLLTYECNFECDHCFVWGGPRQDGTMSLDTVRRVLKQGADLGTVEWIYLEGGEAFLYYPLLLAAARLARERRFRVGVVTNAYWATTEDDAVEWLRPLAGLLDDLSISRDAYHAGDEGEVRADHAHRAAERLEIPVALIRIAQPDRSDGLAAAGESRVMFRGRAAVELAPRVPAHPWSSFDSCPFENLRDPDRVHVDAFGNLHVCQGICMGNLLRRPLSEICRGWSPEHHPVVGPLLEGGPAALSCRYSLARRKAYADACHFCFESRFALRGRFPEHLGPDAMYGAGLRRST